MAIPHKGGLPHSDTQGSTPARGFPWIFAACHVLHRLLAPRHPPDALLLLINHAHPQRHALDPSPAMHRNHPPLPRQTPCATAKPSLSTHSKNALNAVAPAEASLPHRSALRARRRSRSSQHPGQTPRPTRHGPPLPIPPKRLRAQAKPAESSRASKTHQNLIHNP